QVDREPKLGAEETGLCETGARFDAESGVSESPGDLHCARPNLDGFIQLSAKIVHDQSRYAELTAPTIIPQPLSETFRLVEVRERLRKVPLVAHEDPDLPANIPLVLQSGPALRQVPQGAQCPLQPGGGLPEGGPFKCLRAGLPQVADGGLPDFAPERVMSEPLGLLSQAAGMEPLDSLEDPRVERALAVLDHAAMGRLGGGRVLARALGPRERPSREKDLRGLEGHGPTPQSLIRQRGDRRE